jgi:hypothetical protein
MVIIVSKSTHAKLYKKNSNILEYLYALLVLKILTYNLLSLTQIPFKI